MSDNTTLNPGTLGDVIATDDIGGVKYQRVKISIGADGSATDLSSAAPMPISDNSGSLTVDGTVAATQSGTWTVTGSGGTFPVTDSGGSLTVDGTVAISGTVAVTDNSGSLTVDGTVAATQSGTWTVTGTGGTFPVTDSGGSLTVDYATTGSGTATGALRVELPTNGTGVIATVGAVTAITNTVATGGDVAHDGVDSGSPVKVGYKAVAVGAAPSPVAAGDRTDSYANRHGIPFVQPGHPNVVSTRVQYTSTQTNAAIVTQATGGKVVVTCITVAVDNAATDNIAIRVGFGTASTPTGSGTLFSHPGMPAGFIHTVGNGGGILGIGADDEDVRITTGTITSETLDVTLSYYVLPS